MYFRISINRFLDINNSFLYIQKSIYSLFMDIQNSKMYFWISIIHFWISKNRFMDILKYIFGYPKISVFQSVLKYIFGYPKIILNLGYP